MVLGVDDKRGRLRVVVEVVATITTSLDYTSSRDFGPSSADGQWGHSLVLPRCLYLASLGIDHCMISRDMLHTTSHQNIASPKTIASVLEVPIYDWPQ